MFPKFITDRCRKIRNVQSLPASCSIVVKATDVPVLKSREMKIQTKPWIWIVVASFFSLLSIPCSAESVCPWLNAATASGVLEGSATVEVSNPGVGIETCVFRFQDGSLNNVLRITVVRINHSESSKDEMKSYEAGCTSSQAPLKALGNEAALCVSNAGLSRGELVVGRVRNNIFMVTISTRTADAAEAVQNNLAEKAQVIAKQVAGSLF
jgi:hypothetical protein